MDTCNESFLFIRPSLIDLDLDSRSQVFKTANMSVPIVSQSFHSVSMKFGVLLILVGVMNLILILSLPFNIQGRKPYLCDFNIQKF